MANWQLGDDVWQPKDSEWIGLICFLCIFIAYLVTELILWMMRRLRRDSCIHQGMHDIAKREAQVKEEESSDKEKREARLEKVKTIFKSLSVQREKSKLYRAESDLPKLTYEDVLA